MSALLLASVILSATIGRSDNPPAIFGQGETILFQGDSITDGGRGRTPDPNHILGHSYPFLIAAKYGATYPERNLTFINRGNSGDTVNKLLARWKVDTLDNKPDVLSVLVGVNDVLLTFWAHKEVSVRDYENTYDQILAQAVAANPKVRIILCEPFFLKGKNTSDRFDDWTSTLQALRMVVERLGKKYHAPVVHLQRVFDNACKRAPIDHWIWDGIHPTYSGHQLIADEWVKTYKASYGLRR